MVAFFFKYFFLCCCHPAFPKYKIKYCDLFAGIKYKSQLRAMRHFPQEWEFGLWLGRIT